MPLTDLERFSIPIKAFSFLSPHQYSLKRVIPTHEHYMKMAIDLALKAKGRTSPNPMVGAVVTKDGKVVGSGYHQKAGKPHAEIEALNNSGEKAREGNIYVNLEPCSYFGRTPPCCDALIESGIKKVFIGMKDPNLRVSGKGIEKLNNAGIETVVGIMEKESRRTNEIFAKFITTQKPFVILKSAASLDGKIAVPSGRSKWITGEKAREKVHEIRAEVDAVMVGVNTVIMDNPYLTARLKGKEVKSPLRIILDSSLRIPENSEVLRVSEEIKTVIATTEKAPKKKVKRLELEGIKIICPGEKDGKVDLEALMVKLGGMEITSVLIEGGSEVNASVLRSRIVDKIVFFYAPKIIGGTNSPPMFGQKGVGELSDAVRIVDLDTLRVGEDIMVTGYVYGNN